jgi:transposase
MSVMTASNEFWTTKAVATAFGVSANTVRAWINKKVLPEPGWGRRGQRKERHYSREWITAASAKLDLPVDWSSLEGQ